LLAQPWVKQFGVDIRNVQEALLSEDDFDALMSAAALLRCVLEGTSVESAHADPLEGGILASESLNLALPAQTFSCEDDKEGTGRTRRVQKWEAFKVPSDNPPQIRRYPCPIPGCTHPFEGGRGGWDRHVEIRPVHPDWHPEITDKEERKRLFRAEFPQFFER
jgi:hypothetical protein